MSKRLIFPIAVAIASLLATTGFVVTSRQQAATADEKAAPTRGNVKPKARLVEQEYRAVAFGDGEAAATARLNDLADDGWEYLGPLDKGLVAFRRDPQSLAHRTLMKSLQGTWEGFEKYQPQPPDWKPRVIKVDGKEFTEPWGPGVGGAESFQRELVVDGTSYTLGVVRSHVIIHRGTIRVLPSESGVHNVDLMARAEGKPTRCYRGVMTQSGETVVVCLGIEDGPRPTSVGETMPGKQQRIEFSRRKPAR